MHFTITIFNLVMPNPVFEDELGVLGVIMTQLSLKEGLKRFEAREKQGVLREMKPLMTFICFFPRDPRPLTREERHKTLLLLMFLKEESMGQVKRHTCVSEWSPKERIH